MKTYEFMGAPIKITDFSDPAKAGEESKLNGHGGKKIHYHQLIDIS